MGNIRPPRPAYPPEFRARAVALARASGLAPSQVARNRGNDPDSLRRWLRQADGDAGRRQGATTDEQAAPVRLRREAALFREERDSLQQATAHCARTSAPRCACSSSSPLRPPSC